MDKAKQFIDCVFPAKNVFHRDADGEYHYDGGPAVELTTGQKYWYQHGKYHREDGPAIEYANGSKEWYKHGELHRTDGPAVEYASGDKEWWVNYREFTEDEFNRYVDQTTGEVLVPPGKKLTHDD